MVYRPNFRQRTHVYNTRPVRNLGGLKWKFKGDDFVYSPIVVNGLVYFGSGNHTILAVDASGGQEEWRFQTETAISTGLAIYEGVIYFACQNAFCALDLDSPRIKWMYSAKKKIDYSFPALADNVVYFGCHDKNLYALDAATGQPRWIFPTKSTIESSPTVLDGVVYVGSYDNRLYAIHADSGTTKWTFRLDRSFIIHSSPAVGSGMVYFGVHESLYALDIETGEERWRRPIDAWAYCSPTYVDGLVYMPSYWGADPQGRDGGLYALDATTGEDKWIFHPYRPDRNEIPKEILHPSITGAEISSGPIVAGDMVYVGTRAGYLHALDRITGEEHWRFKTDGYWVSDPFVDDGSLYFGSSDGYMYALTEADPLSP